MWGHGQDEVHKVDSDAHIMTQERGESQDKAGVSKGTQSFRKKKGP